MTGLPWLFIDMDGVVNRQVSDEVAICNRIQLAVDNRGPIGHRSFWFNPADRELLHRAQADFRLAWATWRDDAEDLLNQWFGLDLRAVDFYLSKDYDSKVPGLWRRAGSAPFVWLDDDVTSADEHFLSLTDVPHLVIRVDPEVGLTSDHFDEARSWAQEVSWST